MPRSLSFRNAIAAITMAVASLCGGGKAIAEQKGTLSVAEVRAVATTRADTRRRQTEIVAVVSETEIAATDRADDTRATASERAALHPLVSARIGSSGVTTRSLPTHQVSEIPNCIRPPTRAPPHGIANRLADGLGCA